MRYQIIQTPNNQVNRTCRKRQAGYLGRSHPVPQTPLSGRSCCPHRIDFDLDFLGHPRVLHLCNRQPNQPVLDVAQQP